MISIWFLNIWVWKIQFDKLDFFSSLNFNFEGYMVSKNLVWTRPKIQFIKLDFQIWFFKNQVEINKGLGFSFILHQNLLNTQLFHSFPQHSSIFLPIIDNLICFFGNGMIESMLEPHLRSVGATQTEVGLTFLILGGVYMVTTPIAGYVRACCILKILYFFI